MENAMHLHILPSREVVTGSNGTILEKKSGRNDAIPPQQASLSVSEWHQLLLILQMLVSREGCYNHRS